MATITSAANGNWSAGASWVGGVAPVNGDKVYIAHTSAAKSTISTDAAGYAIGATAITMTGTVAAGSFVVGESVTFYGDPNYYPIVGWVSATKVLTIGGAGLIIAIPAASTRVTSRGHVITIDTNAIEGGDDTTTAINVTGTLKWSRTATSQLTVQGELLVLTGGTFDMGQSADAIPVAYTATLKANRSASPSDAKYGVTFQDNTGLYIYGAAKTTNAKVVSDVAIGATTARVTDGTGWAVGDRVIFGATDGVTTAQDIVTIATITPVSGTIYDITWIGGTTYGHLTNGIVGNFTNNCIITPYNTSHRSYFYALWNTVQPDNSREMRYVTFENWATNTSGGTFYKQAGICFYTVSGIATNQPWISIGNIAIYHTLTASGHIIFGNNKGRITLSDIAMYSTSGSSVLCYSGSVADFYRVNIYRGSTAVIYGYSEGMRNARWYDSVFSGVSGYSANFNGGIQPEYYNCYFYASSTSIYQGVSNSPYFESCYFGAGGDTPTGATTSSSYFITSGVGNIGTQTLKNCHFDPAKSIIGGTYKQALPTLLTAIENKNADVTLHELYYPDAKFYRENAIISRGKSSIAYSAATSMAKDFKTIYIPASNGVAVTIKGRLRKNAAYGASTRPTVTLSGLGITPQSFTMTDTTDTWEEFTFTATQSSGNDGNLSLILTCQSASTSALAYLDGVLYDPFCQYKDFYGYSYAPTTPALTVDPIITVATEATVAAYTGISISGGVITMTENHTIEELYDYCQYHRVINQLAPFFTSSDGVNFTCTYDLTMTSCSLTGTGAISMLANTLTMTGSDSTVSISASNGVTGLLTVTGLSAHSIILNDDTPAEVEYNASVTGTYTRFIPLGSTGTWTFVAKKAGYDHQVITFNAATGGAYTYAANTPLRLAPDGSSMYQGLTSVYCAVSFTGTTQANIDIANGTATLQAVFDECEVALCTNAGMAWLASGNGDTAIFNSGGGDYLFLTDDWRLRRASAGDVNATIQAFITSSQGLIVDGVNGGVQFLTSDSPTAIAAEVWAALLTANNDPATFGKLLQDMQVLVDELHKLQGLDISNPMTVTSTTRTTGTITQEISGDGLTTSTVTRTA